MFKLYSKKKAKQIIETYGGWITHVSETYSVPEAYIKAILYKEIIEINLLDPLADFAVKTKSVRIITDFGYFCATNQSKTFHVPKGSQISIFSLNPQQEITSRGLRYPLNRLRLTRWHMGTLNEALTDKFSLELTGDSPVILFVAD